MVAALVWGSIKLAILVSRLSSYSIQSANTVETVSNFASYFDKLSEWFMKLGKFCPRLSEYQILYASSTRLQAALSNFYATVIQFCKQAMEVIQRGGIHQAAISLWNPFQKEFRSFDSGLRSRYQDIKEEIQLAEAQAINQERQLQSIERMRGRRFRQKLDKRTKELCEDRIQIIERSSKKKKQRLLDALSYYDYGTVLHQERKNCHGTTSSWLSKSVEFDKWLVEAQSSVFWCSGKLGSGKTVLTANMIYYLLCRPPVSNLVTYFLCRQCLNVKTLPKPIETQLEALFKDTLPDADDLYPLFEAVVALSFPRVHFIVIDGIDECLPTDRNLVLGTLRKLLHSSQTSVKVFLASREEMRSEVASDFRPYYHTSMNCPEVRMDIAQYIEDEIKIKIDNPLVVQSSELILNIRKTLEEGAEGMFLWVKLMLLEICDQTCDEDIRKTIEDLPKTIEEIYERATNKIFRTGKLKIAKKVFHWVAAAKRPLLLDELREAIAIEPCQAFSRPERLINDINQLVPLCGNLVTIVEDERVVQFAHHSVKKFFLSEQTKSSLYNIHFQLPQVDHEAGEICVTYLNFSDFKTQLTKAPTRQPPLKPTTILKTSLEGGLNKSISNSWSKVLPVRKARSKVSFDVLRKISEAAVGNDRYLIQRLRTDHPFLAYASEYWLSHTADFMKDNTKTWKLWKSLLVADRSLAQTPWTYIDWERRTRKLTQWISEKNHKALLRLIGSSDTKDLPPSEKQYLWLSSAVKGHLQLIDILIDLGNIKRSVPNRALQAAAGGGHLEVVERLLAATANVNAAAAYNGRTALQAAAEGGYLEVVERLLAADANVNATADNDN
ncbi:hypothetical protein MMC14_007012, partial [Varicellaria rhodocarpa]|nr:hypothetical protein [Varicellaria rhodocarpa]